MLTLASFEVFPTAIQSVRLVFTTCAQWLGPFIIVYSSKTLHMVLFFLGTSIVIGAAVFGFFMPKTKRLSLEEMDILFIVSGSALTQRKQANRIISERREAENIANGEKQNIGYVEQARVFEMIRSAFNSLAMHEIPCSLSLRSGLNILTK